MHIIDVDVEKYQIMVCAPPNSGNKLVSSLLKEAGIRAYICHTVHDVGRVGEHVDKAILLIRSQPFWDKKLKSSRPDLKVWFGKHSSSVFTLHEEIKNKGIDPLIITYEALVAHPEEVVKALYAYYGLELEPVIPMKVYDANSL